jgi:hypothetical protein
MQLIFVAEGGIKTFHVFGDWVALPNSQYNYKDEGPSKRMV